jgi:twitching motility protein PilT
VRQPVTPLLDPYLDYLVAVEATDLHLSAGAVPRIRIDGRLLPIPDSPACADEFVAGVLAEVLDDADRRELAEAHQVDFAFSWAGGEGRTARFRGNAYLQQSRPSLALRLIPTEIPTPEQIGLPEATAALVRRPHGLVLMTGPTGSGKSTTLATMLGWINRNRPVHILTIEDPIEYVHTSATALVNQREVGRDCSSFADALRAALREDPDVVLVGEMRDLETVQLALTLAETGHLVFGTVHTNDAAQTVDRIVDTFPHGQQAQIRTQFSMTLSAVISQRLVPRIGGGRVAAYEVMMGTPAIANLIREGQVRQIRNMIATGMSDGMMVLEHSLSRLVADGVVAWEDALAASVYPEEVHKPQPIPVLGPDGRQVIGPDGQPVFRMPGDPVVDLSATASAPAPGQVPGHPGPS